MTKNPAATSVRMMAFLENHLVVLRHFHNRKSLFGDLPGIVEFSLLVTEKKAWTSQMTASIGLDLDEFGHLEHAEGDNRFYSVSVEGLKCKGGDLLILSRGSRDELGSQHSLYQWIIQSGVALGIDLHRTQDESSYVDLSRIIGDADDGRDPIVAEELWVKGFAALRNSRSLWQFTDVPEQRHPRWDPRINLVVPLTSGRAMDKAEMARFFRLAIRESCGSPKTNERSLIAAVLPPRGLCIHKVLVEQLPAGRPNSHSLYVSAVLNSHPVDAKVRPMVQCERRRKSAARGG